MIYDSDTSRDAIVIYAAADRDICDFLDLLPAAATSTLELLLQMLKALQLAAEQQPAGVDLATHALNRNIDAGTLNALCVGPVERELNRRRTP